MIKTIIIIIIIIIKASQSTVQDERLDEQIDFDKIGIKVMQYVKR